MPTVSVVLPTYNRRGTLERAMRSVLGQTFDDLELIVVDDGSTDGTEALVAGLAEADSRIRYIRNAQNRGQSASRNVGIAESRGQFIAFQDSDDEWLPEKLARQVAALSMQPDDVGMVYCFVHYITPEKTTILYTKRIMPDEPDLYKKGLQYLFRGIGIQACMFRREVFGIAGGFDEKMRGALDDTELLIRVARHFRFTCVDEPLVNYFKTPGGLTAHYGRILDSALYIFDKYEADIRKDRSILAAQYDRISRQYGKVGMRFRSRWFKASARVAKAMSRLG